MTNWWQSPDELARRIREAGSIRNLANTTGVPRSTLGDWAHRLSVSPAPAPPDVKWGYGPAQPVKAATREPWEVVVFLSDIHVPYQDHALVDSAIGLVERLQPHRVVVNGDLWDFHSISRFNTSAERLDSLQEEIDEGVELLERIRQAAPNAVLDFNEGNHDNRIKTYVRQNAKALHTLRALRPEELFAYKRLGYQWHPGSGFLLRPHFLVKHGTIVRGEAGATAKAELMQAGISGISGHTHRLATYRRAGYVPRQWTEQGCLCRLDPDYISSGVANWACGVVVGEFATRSDVFHVQEVPAVGGALRLIGAAA